MQTLRFARILAGALLATAFLLSSAIAAPRFGLEGAANVGQLGESTILGNGHYWKWGGGLAALSTWVLAPGWSVEAAPGWERQVRRGTYDVVAAVFPGTFPIDQSIRFDRLVLPLRAAWRPATRGLSLEGGLGFAWTVLAERRNESDAIAWNATAGAAAPGRRATTDADIFEDVGTFDVADWTNSFHREDAFVSLGAGWDQPAGGVTLRLRTRWQQGLNDLAKYGEPIRLSSGALALGLLW